MVGTALEAAAPCQGKVTQITPHGEEVVLKSIYKKKIKKKDAWKS